MASKKNILTFKQNRLENKVKRDFNMNFLYVDVIFRIRGGILILEWEKKIILFSRLIFKQT